MTTIEIKHLFQLRRFPSNELKLLCLILYLPVGLVLFVLRTILALIVVLIGCTLSDSPIVHKLVNKIACLSLGISVVVENPDKKENVEVYISNNLSSFDHLAIHAATGSVSPGNQIHPSLSKGLGIHYFGSLANVEAFKKNVITFISEQKNPVHFVPEEKVTNGRALLKFETYPFAVSSKVQPICISIDRSFLDISVTILGANYWVDIFYYMFSPFTSYKLRFLPSMEKKSLADVEFAEIIRQNIAAALKIEVADFSASDLNEWEKRKLAEQQRVRPTTTTRAVVIDSEVRRMALQVKDVLPHVPVSAIYKDLSKTRNVDSTITNILEGRVYFIPEPPSSTSGPSEPSTSSASISSSTTKVAASTSNPPPQNKDLFNTAASTFAKSAHERSKSFQERKEQLIANARSRYIEKHGLSMSF